MVGDKRRYASGAVVSPLIANVYLHYTFDLWADVWRRKVAKVDVIIVRYAEDLVMGFQQRADAVRFLEALVTALFSSIGKTLIGLYLGKSSVASAYGAAGSVIVVIVWVYYSAQIFFFGAEFTHAYTERRSSDPEAGSKGSLAQSSSA